MSFYQKMMYIVLLFLLVSCSKENNSKNIAVAETFSVTPTLPATENTTPTLSSVLPTSTPEPTLSPEPSLTPFVLEAKDIPSMSLIYSKKFLLLDHSTLFAVSPDGSLLASASNDSSSIYLWSMGKNGLEPLSTIETSAKSIRFLLFSPDGRFLLSGETEKGVFLWRVSDGELEALFEREREIGAVEAAFSQDGERLAVAYDDRQVYIWDVASRQSLKNWLAHRSEIIALEFSVDGKDLASATSKEVKIWNMEDFEQKQRFAKDIVDIHFLPSEPMLIALSGKSIYFWSIETGEQIKKYNIHDKETLSFSLSADGSMVASSAKDGTVSIWDVSDGHPLATCFSRVGNVNLVLFAGKENNLWTLAEQGYVRYWKFDNDRLIGQAVYPENAGNMAVSQTKDPLMVMAEPLGSAIYVWDLRSGILLRSFWDSETSVSSQNEGEKSLNVIVQTSVDISADGSTVVSYGEDGIIRLWDVASGKLIQKINLACATLPCNVSFSSSSADFLAASSQNKIYLFARDNEDETFYTYKKTPVYVLAEHRMSIDKFAFSADGKMLLSISSGENMVRLWEVSTGESLYYWNVAGVNSVAFSPNGKIFAVGSRRNKLYFISVENKEKLYSTETTTYSLSFSQDGSILLTESRRQGVDGVSKHPILFFDASNGTEIWALTGFRERYYQPVFVNNDQWVLTQANTMFSLWEFSAE